MLSLGALEELDIELARLAGTESAIRLRLGQALEVMGRGAHFDLGFSSLGAYALERCERSVRWVEAARCLARRLEQLPELRRALALGAVSWSMGEILGKVAQAGDEAAWLEAAQGCTVREMRERVAAVSSGSAQGAAAADHGLNETGALEDGEMCSLICTVDREEAWLFEATRALLSQFGEQGDDAQVEALLAEGHGTLLAAVPRGSIDERELEAFDAAQQCWNEQRARWRAEAEMLCEGNIRQANIRAGMTGDAGSQRERGESMSAVVEAAVEGYGSLIGIGSGELDEEVRRLSGMLARKELELAQGLLLLHRADGWRRLGHATEAQYARERLGMSRSSLIARRSLGSRLERLPEVASALESGRVGVEAALQIVRVATSSTASAWLERAERRTIKHLREEVNAALVAVRVSGERDCLPPSDEEMNAFQGLERAVVGGGPTGTSVVDSALRGDAWGGHGEAKRRSWQLMLSSLASWLFNGFQGGSGFQLGSGFQGGSAFRMSAGHAACRRPEVVSAGRVSLRLRVSRGTHAWWRGLEAQAKRWLPCGVSWLKFLCLSFWRAWQHMLGADVAYGHIYIRDRFRCTSPVCNRRDVTPHHLQFRSAGGSDEDSNVASVCTWCHLFGVHGGRIRARGTGEHIDWELGPLEQPCVVVHGRERVAA